MNALNHAALAIPAAHNDNGYQPVLASILLCHKYAESFVQAARRFQIQAEAPSVALFERKRLVLLAEANALLADGWSHQAEGDASSAEIMWRRAHRLFAQARAVHHA